MIDVVFAAIENDEDRSTLEKFYIKYKNCLLNVAYSNLHNRSDAEDAVHQAFQEVVRKPENFFNVEPGMRVAYMIAVVRNISIDIFNKKTKMPLAELDDEETYNDNTNSFEDDVIQKISSEKLISFIEELPNLQRDVLVLRYLMGLSTAETAERLKISQSAVKKRLRLAKESVREFIKKENELYE